MEATEPFVDRGFLTAAVLDPEGTAKSVPAELRSAAYRDLQYEFKRLDRQRARLLKCWNLLKK